MRQRWLIYISILSMITPLWALDVEPVAWWALNEDSGDVAADAVSTRDGTVYNGAAWIEGVWDNGLDFDGSDDYVDLPIGDLIATLDDVTIAVWVDFSQDGGSWQRIWDMGSGTAVNWFLTPMNGSGRMRAAITVGGGGGESQVTADSILPTDWHHVAVSIDSDSMVMSLLLDGEVISQADTHLVPSDLGETTQNWLGRSQYSADAYFNGSLDDMRIYDVCLSASEVIEVMADSSGGLTILSPEPADGSVGVDFSTVLRWPEQEEAVFYVLYFGTSQEDVTLATTTDTRHVIVSYTIPTNQYAMESLDRKQTYYWRIDALTQAGIVKGDVWSFTTTGMLVLDDFETYTDDMDADEAIFQTWIDGWGNPYNGAWIGYQESPFAERSIVFEGSQSMPLWYDNLDGFAWAELSWEDYWAWLILKGYEEPNAIYSEATRTFAPVMDWAAEAQYLVLYVRGDETNTGGDLYLTVNDAVIVHPDPNALITPLWQQWVIDFNEIDTDLSQVETLTLGVVGQDTGVMYVDSIGLYDVLPDTIEPRDPGMDDLAVWYDMDGDLTDQSGHQLDAVTSGNSDFVGGVAGQALEFDGSDDYVIMPIGDIVAQTQDMTLTSWVNFSGAGGSWQRLFDLGSNTSINMFLTPRNSSGVMRFAIRTASVSEQQLTAEYELPTGWHHVTVVILGSSGTMAMYLDGQMIAEGITELAPMDMGVTTQNWLGRSQYSDPYFQGSLDEFRIYTRGLTQLEIQYLALGNL